MRTASGLAHKAKQRPRQADLRRAVSSAYYAMFHALCELSADNFIGTPHVDRCERAWKQTYRAMNHRDANKACIKCENPRYGFPSEITSFARYFKTMQELRHSADYDPITKFHKADVQAQISSCKAAIKDLNQLNGRHKSAFAAIMLFKTRD